MFYLGVDVAKNKLDCQLLDASSGKRKCKVIANTKEGIAELFEWLERQKVLKDQVHVIAEPTGVYHELLVFMLVEADIKVSLINSYRLRKYAEGIGVQGKNDSKDSYVLAQYGADRKPSPWKTPVRSARILKELLLHRDVLSEDLQRIKNRLEKTNHNVPVTPQSILDIMY